MKTKQPVPKAKGLDNTMKLLNEGFLFITNRRKALGSDVFETRLLGKKAVCMAGEEAVEKFYDTSLFVRENAVPSVIGKSLLGSGIHGMDGEPHLHRKRMFLSMMTPERLEDMKDIALQELDKKAKTWEKQTSVPVFDEMKEVLVRSGCRWAGVPLPEHEVEQRTKEIGLMVDSFGSLSRMKEGKKARESQEAWLKQVIKDVRKGKIEVPEHTAAYIIAHFRDEKGKKLDAHSAGIELNNAIRPLAATAYFLVFGFLAVHENPEEAEKLRRDEQHYGHKFAQEVRRYYPFAPAMAAKVKTPFTWKDYAFKKNQLVVLDFFGTNRMDEIWGDGDRFRPERFEGWKGSPFAFVPQGGGDHYAGHRCAGEWMTVMVMRSFFKYMTQNISYRVPDQDLQWDYARVPTIPKSGFVIDQVTRRADSTDALEADEESQTVVKS
ncbi:cytochrome P450 [Alkalicoccus chagannorensis]|uniref:cytochrome P450 n=1 Tax=Alkalicoccus chagannorensis TaxID=427072 RepID=UPI0004089F20|nr:cytochrome P450 [Alkalicoccus chagannorensis]